MKRSVLMLVVVAALSVASCSSTWYTVKSVSGTAPLHDNFTRNCTNPDTLVLVGTAYNVTIRCEWWQNGALLKADSLVVQRGSPFTFQPPTNVPNGTKVTATAWVRDEGGTSCPATLNQTPTATLVPPARATLAVVP